MNYIDAFDEIMTPDKLSWTLVSKNLTLSQQQTTVNDS